MKNRWTEIAHSKLGFGVRAHSILLICVTAFVWCAVGQDASKDSSKIDEAMQRYLRAALARDGEAVAKSVTTGTADWWSSLINQAKTKKKADVRSLSVYKQASLLLLRARLGQDGLKELSGREFIILSYTNGWNSTEALKKIDEVYSYCGKEFELKGDTAILRLRYRGEPIKGHFAFKKEAGEWRLDGVDHFELIEERMRTALSVSGLDEEEFIQKLVEKGVGRFDPNWWNP